MELNGWTSPQMLRRYGASARSARARRTHDRIMTDTQHRSPGRHPASSMNDMMCMSTRRAASASAAPARPGFCAVWVVKSPPSRFGVTGDLRRGGRTI